MKLQSALNRAGAATKGGRSSASSSQDKLQREGMAFARAWNQAHAEDARRTKQALVAKK